MEKETVNEKEKPRPTVFQPLRLPTPNFIRPTKIDLTPKIILYYSDDSNPCLKLLQILNDNPAVDRTVERVKIKGKKKPSDVHLVPSIRIGTNLLVGKKAYDYIVVKVCKERSTFSSLLKVLTIVLLITFIVDRRYKL